MAKSIKYENVKPLANRDYVALRIQFGVRVKYLRISCALSQEELAVRSRLHRNYVSDVERGKRNISFEALQKLADGFGIGIQDLF
jgi:transcriptional regulator with XRE-family HTH domain